MTISESFTISASLRQAILDHHHGVAPTSALATVEAYQRFLLYLYLPTRLDPDTHQTVISRRVCAACEGVLQSVKSNNYSAKRFLKEFRRDVMPGFEWGGYDMGRRPRTVRHADLCADLRDAAVRTRTGEVRHRVYALTGEKWTPGASREERARRKAEATATAANALCDDQRDVVEYMNARSFRPYAAAARRHVEEARELARTSLDGLALDSALLSLRAVEQQPQPFVQVSERGRSARVYPAGLGLYSLKKELRHVLTQGWCEVDLASAQLAVNARLWECEPVLDFLRTPGADWWRELFVCLYGPALDYEALVRDDPSRHRRVKGALKVATYAGQFGRARIVLRDALDRALPDIPDAGRRLLGHGLFGELVRARDREAERIVGRGYTTDAYGRHLEIGEPDGRDVWSFMAEVAQSYELRLMRPVLDVALARHDDVQILLWIHDGAVVSFSKGGAHEKACRREMDWGVRQVAASLEIPTHLTFDPSIPLRRHQPIHHPRP